jgi:hypothetical protein
VGGALALLLGLLAACGGDDDEPAKEPRTVTSSVSTTPTPEDDGPEASYRAWLAALSAHDAEDACFWHAPELTIELRERAILEQRAELGDPCTGFVALLWEDPTRAYDPTGIEVTQDTGEDAELAVDFPGTDETVSLQRRNGRWLVADVTPRSTGDPDTARWVAGWCELDLDMGREEVIAVMGEPSGEYTVENGGEPQLWWADRQYDFRVYLDASGTILDLVCDYDRLDRSDRRQLDCPELR